MLSQEQIERMKKNKLAALNKKRAKQALQEVSTSSLVLPSSNNQINSIDADPKYPPSVKTNSKKSRIIPNWSENAASVFPPLCYNKGILYVTSSSHANTVIAQFQREKQLNKAKDPNSKFVIGFDIEWKVTYERNVSPRKCATIQLCSPSLCAVFQVCKYDILPENMIDFLADSEVIKVGVGASRDAIKVTKDYDIVIKSVINCEDVAGVKELPHGRVNGKSLQDFCSGLLCKYLRKEESLRKGNWEKVPLSKEQIEYAAIDAYAGLLVYMALQDLPDKVYQMPNGLGVDSSSSLSSSSSPFYDRAMGLSTTECLETKALAIVGELSPSKRCCWDMWHVQGWNIGQVATARSVKVNTVRSYICDAISAGFPYCFDRLGVPLELYSEVAHVIDSLSSKLELSDEVLQANHTLMTNAHGATTTTTTTTITTTTIASSELHVNDASTERIVPSFNDKTYVLTIPSPKKHITHLLSQDEFHTTFKAVRNEICCPSTNDSKCQETREGVAAIENVKEDMSWAIKAALCHMKRLSHDYS